MSSSLSRTTPEGDLSGTATVRVEAVAEPTRPSSQREAASSNPTAPPFSFVSLKTGLSLVALCAITLLLITRGMTDEATASLQGDMPRYLMNGVYFYDFIHDLPLAHPLEYTYRYYAKYPALSLGHHPLLLSLAEVPFYAALGVSVFSARVTVAFFMLMGLVAWYALVARLYNRDVAFFAAALLVTTPYIVDLSCVVLSEIPTLALVLVTAYFFLRYCETQRPLHAYTFAIAQALSVYGKHLALFMLPVFLLYLVLRNGVRALLKRELLIAIGVVIALVLPLVPITLEFSRANVAWVARADAPSRISLPNVLYYLETLWHHHLTVPVLVLSVLGLFLSAYLRDRRAVFPVLWIVLFYLQITYTGAHESRYAIYWIPAFCLLAAATYSAVPLRSAKAVAAAVLTLTVVYQFIAAWQLELVVADGYEEAAEYVVQHSKGDTVLFGGNVDSGYFVFFVRKHDVNRGIIVLRADKTLVTSSLSRIIATQLTSREQIYEMLRNFGTAYVVLEDAPFSSPPLELLRQEVRTDHFALRKRIPFRSNSDKLQGVDLVVYEYLEHTPAKRDQPLQMRIPLMGGDVAVRFGDLLPEKTGDAVQP